MNYKAMESDLYQQLVAGITLFTEVDETDEIVPYGIMMGDRMIGSMVADGYLDSGTFVSVIPKGEPNNPTLYGFSESTRPAETTDPQYGAWALALHMHHNKGTQIDGYQYRLFKTTMFLSERDEAEVLYVYLNGIPFCEVTIGRTQTYFCLPVLDRYHADVHKFTEDLFQVMSPYFTETMKYRNAPQMHRNLAAAFEKVVAVMDDLMDGGCRAGGR